MYLLHFSLYLAPSLSVSPIDLFTLICFSTIHLYLGHCCRVISFDVSSSATFVIGERGREKDARYDNKIQTVIMSAFNPVSVMSASEPETERTRFRRAGEIVASRLLSGKTGFSFEYYPPKTDKGVETLKKRFGEMWSWGADWMDITWGAGGLTSELTTELCEELATRDMNPMMHLTCTNMPAEKIDEALDFCAANGIRNILALRGDPPAGKEKWEAVETGFSCALDLVKYIQKTHPGKFSITVAGYPEGHPNVRKPIPMDTWNPKTNIPFYWAAAQNAEGVWEGVSYADWHAELLYLKAKVDAGAELVTTQLFYDVDLFLNFVKDARRVGIRVPILPGIMPIRNAGSFRRMTGFCKTVVPPILNKTVELLKDDNDKLEEFGLVWITEMMKKIFASGVIASIHIYTMNTESLPKRILDGLDLLKNDV